MKLKQKTIQTYILNLYYNLTPESYSMVSYTVLCLIQRYLLQSYYLLTSTIRFVVGGNINNAPKVWWHSREVNNRSAGAIEAGRKLFRLGLAWITHSDWETNYGRQQAVLSLCDCRAHPHYGPSHRWLGLRGRGRRGLCFLQLLVSTQLQNWIEIP